MPAPRPLHPASLIVALLPDRARADRLRVAFGTDCRFVDAQPALVAASRLTNAGLVVLSPRDRAGAPVTTSVAAIRASRRSPPVYVYGDRSVECLRELLALGRAGAQGLIVAGVDDDVASLRRLRDHGTLARAVDAVAVVVHQVVSPRHLPLLLLCLEHITEPPTADGYARQLKVSRRTLTSWAGTTGARGIRSLTSRCRVLVAVAMLRDGNRSIEQVAHELHFSSSAHLHNTILRYTGLRPRQAAAVDASDWCRRFFTARDSPPSVRAGADRAAKLPPAEMALRGAEWSRTPNDHNLPPHRRITR